MCKQYNSTCKYERLFRHVALGPVNFRHVEVLMIWQVHFYYGIMLRNKWRNKSLKLMGFSNVKRIQ